MKENPPVNASDRPTQGEALASVRTLLRFIGENPDRTGLIDTPQRLLRSFDELYAGYGRSPEDVLGNMYPTCNQEMVVLKNVEFDSTCEHHMLPFQGVCHIGYLPAGKIIGIGNLAGLIDLYARRLQIQEELTVQIALALNAYLQPRGMGVIVNATHMCMSCRGTKKKNALVSTASMHGLFCESEAVKQEFYNRSQV